VVFLYINNEQIEKEYRKMIPFTIVSKNKIPRNIFTKDVKYLKENYKPLKKEIKKDYSRWKDLPCSVSRIT
jgi:uncharacterized protein YlbG (UPF0298 family)